MPGYGAGGGSTSIWLTLGQSMAAGGLLGDVFLHTLEETSSKATGVWILGGFTFFLMSDLLIRSIQEETGTGHSHNHHQECSENGSAKSDSVGAQHIHMNRSAIILSIAGDALHNFTDGLAIGASYSMAQHGRSSATQTATLWQLLTSHKRGGLATLSILFHEVPHELGDFCTLVRAGYSTRQAVMTQLYTAVAAFIGTAIAIVVSEEAWAEEQLILITAGGFLYLAGTTILPEVLSDEGIRGRESKTSKRWLRFAQLIAFCFGIFFLYMVAVLEEAEHGSADGTHSHHHHHHGGHHHHHHHLSEVTDHDHPEL